jgi:uncharacterized membrane protein
MKTLKILIISCLLFIFSFGVVLADENIDNGTSTGTDTVTINSNVDNNKPKSAEAQVLRVLDEKVSFRENGSKTTQQNLELGILTGPFKGQTEVYTGISGIDNVSSNVYKANDKVLVSYNRDETGAYVFYVTDYVRNNSLLWLVLIFITIVLIIGGLKGLMSLLSLMVSFVAIVYVLVPLVFAGYNPLLVGIVISVIILFSIIYLTEGWNKKSHVSVVSIFISLLVAAGLSIVFGHLSRLSGTSQEEVVFLIDAIKKPINFYYLLLASIIIGALGVLDDIVVGQVEAVSQIKIANPSLKATDVFVMSMKVGRAHLGAIINTLFLTYASVALPLILLFSVKQEPFLTFSQVVNHEDIATEIVRTLVGAISLCLAAPIATFLAVKYIKVKK